MLRNRRYFTVAYGFILSLFLSVACAPAHAQDITGPIPGNTPGGTFTLIIDPTVPLGYRFEFNATCEQLMDAGLDCLDASTSAELPGGKPQPLEEITYCGALLLYFVEHCGHLGLPGNK